MQTSWIKRLIGGKRPTAKSLFEAACREAAGKVKEQQYRDALAVYERFATDHPTIHPEEIEKRIRALKIYIEEHFTKPGPP